MTGHAQDRLIISAAILVSEDGRYLMQHRDAFEWIDCPAHWSCFGGQVEPGETGAEALLRELEEEIGYRHAGVLEPFTEISVAPMFPAKARALTFFVVPIMEAIIPTLVQAEGDGMALFLADDLARQDDVIPWDLAAILMHARRHRLFKAPQSAPPELPA